jgi:hypothetical protein
VVEADAIERVEQRKAALDLVRFDHAFEDILDGDALALACQVVRDGEDGTEVVRRVAPFNKGIVVISVGVGAKEADGNTRTFCSKEAVVEVEPTDDGPDVERPSNRVELVVSPGDLGS